MKVLVDGSYKYFRKIVTALGLSYNRNMDLINIEEWAGSCLDNRSPDACCWAFFIVDYGMELIFMQLSVDWPLTMQKAQLIFKKKEKGVSLLIDWSYALQSFIKIGM